MLPTTIIFATLSILGLGAPLQERQLPRRRIHWRNGTDRTHLVICGGGPVIGPGNGNQLRLAYIYRNCAPDYQFDNSGVETTISIGDAGKQCVDATLAPANGVRPHLWDCYPGVPQQVWKFGSDGTIRLNGTNYCLDVTDGDAANTIQLWECSECGANPNQQWDVIDW